MPRRRPPGGEEEEDRLSWSNINLPPGVRTVYMLLTGTGSVIDGLKKLCDSGLAELAYTAIVQLLSRNMALFPSHLELIPSGCRVYSASRVLPHENTDSGYIICIKGYSGRTGSDELSCFYMDDTKLYMRLLTFNEYYRMYKIMEEGGEEAFEGEDVV